MDLHTTDDHDDTDSTAQGAATALADAIRTTLGPNGMDKMVVGENGTVVVTNDGSKIVEWMDITHPVGRLVARVASAQDDAVGDGTTTTVVLAGALIGEAATLRAAGLHPTTIADGYVRAAEVATERLGQYGLTLRDRDDERLTHVARTAVTGRWDDASTDRFADLTLDALRRVAFDTSKLTLTAYPGGELRESACIDGIVVDLDASSTSLDARPQAIDDPTIAMVDGELGIAEPDRVHSVRFEDATQREAFHDRERAIRDDIVSQVTQSGATVLCCQKSVDDAVRTALVQRGVFPVERTRRDEFDVIARATGSTPVTSVDELTASDTGTADSVDHRTVGTTETLVLRGCPCEQRVSLLLRGGTPHVAAEVRRIVADCIDVTRLVLGDGTLVPGGGAVPTALAMDIAAASPGITDRTQRVFDGFAAALEAIPRTLATNAGTDPLDTLTTLRQRHHAGSKTAGVGPDGRPCDMPDAGVYEPSAVFESALRRAVAVAVMVLRVDEVVHTGGDDHAADAAHHDHGHAATSGYPWAVGH